jgi:hypothetical protein
MPQFNQAHTKLSIGDIAQKYSNWLKAPVVPANPQKRICAKGWTTFTPAQSIKPGALILFGRSYCNIGIVLGNGLASIDWDIDELADEFQDLNPWTNDTLVSRANRGANFWIRPAGNVPKSSDLWRPIAPGDKELLGEWRYNGRCTIIHGTHETGKAYQHNEKEPLAIDFSEILWPKGTHPFNPDAGEENLTEEAEEHGYDTEDNDDVVSPSSPNSGLVHVPSVEVAAQISTPSKAHSSDRCMFKFCRALKNLEQHRENKLTISELRQAFTIWHTAALPFLRPEQSQDQYFMEFMHRYKTAKYPLATGRVLTRAKQRADNEPPPIEVALFSDNLIRRLISILYYLQVESGDQPFYLSSRNIASIIGGITHTTANIWMRGLITMNVIREIQKATPSRAARLRYCNVEQACIDTQSFSVHASKADAEAKGG